MVINEVLARLPEHLLQYIKPQPYDHYSSIDQSVWRYVMRKNVDFLSQYAHNSYRKGLEITGISLDKIPDLYGMNRILKDIGWAAVSVDGFIPPRAFMEFQAYNVLVIASEIRLLEHLEYTPAPDIIHESAGHAPMLANPEYASFLKRFGEIGSKAISMPFNKKMFNAIRKLSILKENKDSTPYEIEAAEKEVTKLQNQITTPSEMDYLRNLHWWSVEYGLIGTLENYKLYGAGLLSSIGESQWCLSNNVKKLPFTLDVIHQKFNITEPQPHLFVTPDFAHLTKVLEEVANTMGLRKGGKESVDKLIASEEIGTIELSTGLQISGLFIQAIAQPNNTDKVAYIQTQGPTALAFRNQELIGHGCKQHTNGFGSPLGMLKGSNLSIEDMTPSDLEAFKIVEGKITQLIFESGVTVEGKIITGTRNLFGKIILISFQNCTVRFEDKILFKPEWGQFDLAIGKSVTSAYAGPADITNYPFTKQKLISTPKQNHSKINSLYTSVEELGKTEKDNLDAINSLGEKILLTNSKYWLLALNFYEYCFKNNHNEWKDKILKHLQNLQKKNKSIAHLIEDGIKLIVL